MASCFGCLAGARRAESKRQQRLLALKELEAIQAGAGAQTSAKSQTPDNVITKLPNHTERELLSDAENQSAKKGPDAGPPPAEKLSPTNSANANTVSKHPCEQLPSANQDVTSLLADRLQDSEGGAFGVCQVLTSPSPEGTAGDIAAKAGMGDMVAEASLRATVADVVVGADDSPQPLSLTVSQAADAADACASPSTPVMMRASSQGADAGDAAAAPDGDSEATIAAGSPSHFEGSTDMTNTSTAAQVSHTGEDIHHHRVLQIQADCSLRSSSGYPCDSQHSATSGISEHSSSGSTTASARAASSLAPRGGATPGNSIGSPDARTELNNGFAFTPSSGVRDVQHQQPGKPPLSGLGARRQPKGQAALGRAGAAGQGQAGRQTGNAPGAGAGEVVVTPRAVRAQQQQQQQSGSADPPTCRPSCSVYKKSLTLCSSPRGSAAPAAPSPRRAGSFPSAPRQSPRREVGFSSAPRHSPRSGGGYSSAPRHSPRSVGYGANGAGLSRVGGLSRSGMYSGGPGKRTPPPTYSSASTRLALHDVLSHRSTRSRLVAVAGSGGGGSSSSLNVLHDLDFRPRWRI